MLKFILNSQIRNRISNTMLLAFIIITSFLFIGVLKPTLGIEFTGGVSYTLSASPEYVKSELSNIKGVTVSGNTSKTVIKMSDEKSLNTEQLAFLNEHLLSRDTIGASLGDELIKSSIQGIVLAFIGVLLYLSFRYNYVMALATLIALFHDIAFTMLILCLFKIEISSIVVGAILAIIGYSINDSVVTLDRVRELVKDGRKDAVDLALKMTLRRNIITAISTLIVITTLLIFGGEAMYAFSLTMFAGVGIGMFSSLTIVPTIVSLNTKNGSLKITKTPDLDGEL